MFRDTVVNSDEEETDFGKDLPYESQVQINCLAIRPIDHFTYIGGTSRV